MSVMSASHRGSRSRPAAGQTALPIELRPPVPPAAVSLLEQAQRGLDDANRGRDPAARFVGSYLSALRAGAAVLVARGRPHRGRARPESVWTLLEAVAPELASWAAFFAAHSARHAAAQAGITRRVTEDTASELIRHATEFVALAHRVVHGVPDVAPGIPRQRSTPCGVPARPRRRE